MNSPESIPEPRWWLDAWWEKDNWVSLSRHSLEEIRNAIDVLKATFTAEWAARIGTADVGNIFLRNVRYGQSVWQHRFLVELAKILTVLGSAPGFSQVLNRLRSVDESESAYMELSLAELLSRNGYAITFPVPNTHRGKSPDIVAHDGMEVVAFECKQLETSEKQRWLDQYNLYASTQLMDALSDNDRHVQFEFETPEYDQYFDRNGKPKHDALPIATDAVAKVVADAEARFTENACPLYFGQEGIGYGRFISKDSGESTLTRLAPMSDERLYARLRANGIDRANDQLRAVTEPGIAAIYTEYSPSSELATREFNAMVYANPSHYEYLVACLIFQRQALFHYREPLLLINPLATPCFSDLRISEVLRNLYFSASPAST